MSASYFRYQHRLLCLALFILAVTAQLQAADPPQPPQPVAAALPPPVRLTAQQDHKLMMELLGIKELR